MAVILVHFFGAFAGLGLQNVVNRELIDHPEQSNTLLGSTCALLLMSGTSALVLLLLVSWLTGAENPTFTKVLVIIAATLPFTALHAFRYWFESQVFSKPVVFVESSAIGLSNLGRLILIYLNSSLIAFAGVIFIEYALISLGIWMVFKRFYGDWKKLSIDLKLAQCLLKQSWPILLSGLTAVTLTRIDLFMIGLYIDADGAGTYAAATKISEVWHFFPAAIIASSFPILLKIRLEDRMSYESKLGILFRSTTYMAMAVALSIGFLAASIIELLFGTSYADAAPILTVHIWSGIFVALSISTSYWLIGEKLQRLELIRTSTAAAANILLNIWLIPIYGALGAAYATIFTLFWLGIGFDIFHPSTRELLKVKIRSLLFFGLARKNTELT
jgi:PST family polysaccharide transporter